MHPAAARYREYAPRPELREYVRALFAFAAPAEPDRTRRPVSREVLFGAGDSFSSPLFADGHVSIAFSFGAGYRVDGLWQANAAGPRGHVIGAMSAARPASHGDRIVQVGAYFRAGRSNPFFETPASELTDRIVALQDTWGACGSSVEVQLAEATNDTERVGTLETVLLQRLARGRFPRTGLDVPRMAAWALAHPEAAKVSEIASGAGVSRQYLRRVFREEVGVSPKLFVRLARFRATLAYANGRGRREGAGMAADLGYADQSHMIADFREFSGLTPGSLLTQRRFHPFLEQSSALRSPYER